MWEKFYDASVGAWVRTRCYVGVTVALSQRDSIQLYYMHEDNKYSRPFEKDVIRISFMLSYQGARVALRPATPISFMERRVPKKASGAGMRRWNT